MKRTSAIAVIALLAWLLTGCGASSNATVEPPASSGVHKYAQYGFSFFIDGDVTEVGSGSGDQATFETDLGYLQFIKMKPVGSLEVLNVHQLATDLAQQTKGNLQMLDSGDYIVLYGPVEADYGQRHMVACYFHQFGDSVWTVTCYNTVEAFQLAAIMDLFISINFYK